MLTVDQLRNTKVIPYAVYGGKVHSFQMPGNEMRVFDGDILKEGNDGKVYAVFSHCGESFNFSCHFECCQQASFGDYDNAFCVSAQT
jgi:hypothetical protein